MTYSMALAKSSSVGSLSSPDQLNGRAADHAASVCEGADDVVVMVARVVVEPARVGVRDERRLRRQGEGLEGGAVARVRDVHHDADLVHGRDDLATEAAQSGVARLGAAVTDEVAVVVRQLQVAEPEPLQLLEAPEPVADELRVLRAHHQADYTVLLRSRDVARHVYQPQPGLVTGQPVVRLDAL
jgi:hypothetical protein